MKTIYTKNVPEPVGPYSQAILAGNTLYCSGQIGINPQNGCLQEGIVKQTEQIMKNILTLNSISPVINDIFDASYNVASDAQAPIGIMLRSFKMHDYKLDENTLAIARAGAGTNNIPVKDYANTCFMHFIYKSFDFFFAGKIIYHLIKAAA